MNFKDIIAKHALANGINWRAKTKAEPQELDKSDELAKSEEKSQVSTVAVFDGTKLLMGKRTVEGTWTNPGGHLNKGEDPKDGAFRELFEEAGIEPKDLEFLGSKDVITPRGDKKTIHTYKATGKFTPTAKNDPDKEVKKWEWIETKDGLPEEVASNLHSPDNVLLQNLGLQKNPKDLTEDKIQKSLSRIKDLLKSN